MYTFQQILIPKVSQLKRQLFGLDKDSPKGIFRRIKKSKNIRLI